MPWLASSLSSRSRVSHSSPCRGFFETDAIERLFDGVELDDMGDSEGVDAHNFYPGSAPLRGAKDIFLLDWIDQYRVTRCAMAMSIGP